MKTIGVILVVSLFALNCSPPPPAPVFRLIPTDTEFKWVYGEPLVTRMQNGIEVKSRFIEHAGPDLIFVIEVWNSSEDTVLVEPDAFYYKSYASSRALADAAGIRAYDPDQEIISIEKALSTEHSRHATFQTIDATISVIDLIVDIATIGETTSEDREDRSRDRYERHVSRVEEEASYQERIARLEEMRAMWQNVSLRKTTLYPGESAGGRVLFPVSPHARFLELFLPLGKTEQSVVYEQRRN